MSYFRALRECRRALARCAEARGELHAAVDDLIGTYQARPFPTLAGAAGVGFLLAQFRVGTGFIRTGIRIASGPTWGLVRQFLGTLA